MRAIPSAEPITLEAEAPWQAVQSLQRTEPRDVLDLVLQRKNKHMGSAEYFIVRSYMNVCVAVNKKKTSKIKYYFSNL